MPLPAAQPLDEHILLIKDDRGQRELLLTQPQYTLGRSPSADIRIRSQFVSRIHAVLQREGTPPNHESYYLTDGDGRGKRSVNNLIINGKKQTEHRLASGDMVIFGHQVSVSYQRRRRDQFASSSNTDEPFDITLIDPSMVDNEDETPTDLSHESDLPQT